MEQQYRICKITDKGYAGLVIVWETPKKSGGWEEHTVKSSDLPRPDFRTIKNALIPDVVEILELPVEYENRVSIIEVLCKYEPVGTVNGESAPDRMGVRFKFERIIPTAGAALVAVTPEKREKPHNQENADVMNLSDMCVRRLERLFEECEAYIDGYRMQGDLFNGEEDADVH
jgi:hypothetical protein